MRSIFARYRYLLAIGGLVVVTAPLGVGNRPLCVGDETRETAIAKQMADSGDFLQARLGGMRMVEKPPFFYASVASSIRLRHGVTRHSARLPSILFSALTLLSAAAAASLLFSQRAGLLTAAILATTYLFVVNAHNVVVDVALTAFVSLGLLAFAASSRRAGRPRWDLGFGLAAAGAMLAKGFVGLALLSLLTLPFWLFSRGRKSLRLSVTAGAVLAPLAALLFWVGVTYGRGGMSALSEAIWSQQVGRLLGFRRQEYSHHRAPFYFYLAALPGMLFPWIVTLPAAVGRGLRRKGRSEGSSPAFLALAVGILAALLFLSVAGTKRTIYFLPVVPVAAVLIGSFLDVKLAETVSRAPRILWAQFAVVACAAVAVPLLPAAADGKITPGEAARVAVVTLACAALAFAARRSPPRLVAISLVVAMGSLFLLDGYSLPRWERDRATRDFFTRVETRVAGQDSLYSYDLNQDVLGQACLQLSRPPLAQEDPASLEEVLRRPGAFLLVETAALRRAPASWMTALEPVEIGRAGNRRVALLRFRVRERPPTREARRQEKLAESLPGSGRAEPALVSAHETNSVARAVRKKKPSDQDRQQNGRNDGGDLCAGCLADPEGLARNDSFSDEDAFDEKIKNQRDRQAEKNDFPLARKADRVLDASPEQKAQSGPRHAVDERGAEVAQDELAEVHPAGACGKEDDGPQAIEVPREKDQAVAVPVERLLDLLDFLRREDPFHEAVALQAPSEKPAEAVKNRIGDHDAAKLRADHERKPRHFLKDQKSPD